MSVKYDAAELFFAHGIHLPSRTLVLDTNPDSQIDSSVASSFLKGLHILDQTAEPITVLLNCSGGAAIDGFAIYDAICNAQSFVTIIVVGEAQSMAAIVLQAADHRIAYRHATLMLHDGDAPTEGRYADAVNKMGYHTDTQRNMYEILADRCGNTVAYWRRKLKNDWYLSAQKALAENIIDEVV